MSNQVNLDELKRLHAAATQGKMKWGEREDGSLWYSIGEPLKGPHEAGDVYCTEEALSVWTALFNAFPALAAELEELRKENDTLRGLLANSKADCAYCGLKSAEMAKCKRGFPGCARADDMMAAPQVDAATELESAAKFARGVAIDDARDDIARALENRARELRGGTATPMPSLIRAEAFREAAGKTYSELIDMADAEEAKNGGNKDEY